MAPKHRGPYLGRFRILKESGPFAPTAALARAHNVRWEAAFRRASCSLALNFLQQRLQQCPGVPRIDLTLQEAQAVGDMSWIIVGFAVLSAWCVEPLQREMLCEARTATDDERKILHSVLHTTAFVPPKAVIEMPVQAAAWLHDPLPFPTSDTIEQAVALDIPTLAEAVCIAGH